jgi:hypothetical protein
MHPHEHVASNKAAKQKEAADELDKFGRNIVLLRKGNLNQNLMKSYYFLYTQRYSKIP